MGAIIWKTLYEKRFSIVAWSIGAAAMVWLTMIFYPSFSQGDQLADLVKAMPPQLQSLVGEASSYKTIGGYLDTVVFNLRIPMVVITMAIIFGISLSAGDEEKGILATLLAQPVSRSRALFEKLAALLMSIFIVHIGVLLGIVLSLLSIGDWYSFDKQLAITFGSFLIASVFGVLAFALGIVLGKKGIASAVVATVAFGAFLIDSMAPSVSMLESVQKFSPYYYYSSAELAVNGVDWSYVAIQMLMIILFVSVAWSVFRHRDIEV